MPLYRYKVADSKSQVSDLTLEAMKQEDALQQVKAQGLVPIAFLGETDSFIRRERKKFNTIEFTEKLVLLLDSGVPLEEALHMLEQSMANPQDVQYVHGMRQALHEGRSFSQILKERASNFSELYVHLVAAGEQSGSLSTIMRQLLIFLQEREKVKKHVIASAVYPALISLVSFVAIAFLLSYVVPKFAKVFESGDREAGWFTQTLFDFSNLLNNYWYLLIVFVIIVLLGIKNFFFNNKYKQAKDRLFLKLPLLRDMVLYNNLNILLRTSALMLTNGVHLLATLKMASQAMPSSQLRASLANIDDDLKQGTKLSQALADNSLIPKETVHVIAVGEKTGNLPMVMESLAIQYEDKLKSRIQAGLALFEPLMIIVLGGIVGSIVLAMFMSISSMTSMK